MNKTEMLKDSSLHLVEEGSPYGWQEGKNEYLLSLHIFPELMITSTLAH